MGKREFEIIEEGTTYGLSNWRVVDGKGIEKITECGCGDNEGCSDCGTEPQSTIQFVRGSKLGEEDVPKRDGILHESLLSMMIYDLKFKNGLVPSRETSLAITKLKEALMWMEERQRNRVKAGVQGTYKKH